MFTFGEITFVLGEIMFSFWEITFTFGEITFTLGILADFRVFELFFVAGGGLGLCGSGGPRRGFRKYWM